MIPYVDFFAQLANTVWQFSEQGGGSAENDWIDLFASIGKMSLDYFFGDDSVITQEEQEYIDFISEYGKSAYEYVGHGLGSTEYEWEEFMRLLGDESWEHFYSGQSQVTGPCDCSASVGYAISPELDSMLQTATPVLTTTAIFFLSVSLFKLVWGVGKKIYQFFKIVF